MAENLQRQLNAQYDAIIAKLHKIAPKETEEFLGVVAARKALQSAISPFPTDGSLLPYLYFDSVGEAILDWFRRRNNRAASAEDLKNGVLDGGFLLSSSQREEIVITAIRSQTSDAPYALLRKVGNLIKPKSRSQ